MTACVVDASVVGRWLLDSDADPRVADVMRLALTYGGLVPPLFEFEVANILARWSRSVSAQGANLAAAQVARWPLTVDAEAPDLTQVLAVALESGLTAYDAAYLELALRSRCPLATVDIQLAAAARTAGLDVLP